MSKAEDEEINQRLTRIEKSLGIELSDWQRNYVLNKNNSMSIGMRNGKTITLVCKFLLWRTEMEKLKNE